MASAVDIPVNGEHDDAGENEPLLGLSDSITQKDDHPIQNNLIVGLSSLTDLVKMLMGQAPASSRRPAFGS
jgi:hypothetical protein